MQGWLGDFSKGKHIRGEKRGGGKKGGCHIMYQGQEGVLLFVIVTSLLLLYSLLNLLYNYLFSLLRSFFVHCYLLVYIYWYIY